jgi:hypothetical protein
MREFCLHILDIIESSIKAGASIIAVGIAEDAANDLLEITVEDNGSGFDIPAENGLGSIRATNAGNRFGLGLSVFQAAAEQAGGTLAIEKSSLGGVAVKVKMSLSRIDRRPLGDLAATLSSVVCTNPDLDLWCRFSSGDRPEYMVRVSDVARELQVSERCGLAIARKMSEKIRNGLAAMTR